MSDNQILSAPAMHSLGTELERNATRCNDIARFLKTPMGNMWWQSSAAGKFKENIDQVTKALTDLEPHFKAVGKDVHARAKVLEESKNT